MNRWQKMRIEDVTYGKQKRVLHILSLIGPPLSKKGNVYKKERRGGLVFGSLFRHKSIV